MTNRLDRIWPCALALLLLAGCGSSDDDDTGPGTGGSIGFGGSVASSTGGVFWTGGTFSSGGTFSGGAFSTGGVFSTGGTLSTGGVAAGGSAMGAGKGGTLGSGGTTVPTGTGGLLVPPGPGPNGTSPYQRECHGDTAMCVDVASLRCLGIRVGSEVFGYSCSNPCQTDAECSHAAATAEASVACVDFVTQKHCLLVCLQQGKSFSCPTGMGCYVYPGATIGYCLWQ